MTCITIPNISAIMCIREIAFNCPFCFEQHKDFDDKYLNRINRNKGFSTRVKCIKCNKNFFLTYAYNGAYVTFKKS